MPIHHRIPIIATEIAKRTLAAEGAILGHAWKGFKHKSSIVAGIRSGLGGGAVIGSLITEDSTDPFSGTPGFKSQTNKFSQKYSGQYRNRGSRRYSKQNSTRQRCRCLRRRSNRYSNRSNR